MLNGGGWKIYRNKRTLYLWGYLWCQTQKVWQGCRENCTHRSCSSIRWWSCKKRMYYSYRVHTVAQGQSGGGGDSLVTPHAHSQDRFSEGELQHQLVFGVSWLSSVIPDQHWRRAMTNLVFEFQAQSFAQSHFISTLSIEHFAATYNLPSYLTDWIITLDLIWLMHFKVIH